MGINSWRIACLPIFTSSKAFQQQIMWTGKMTKNLPVHCNSQNCTLHRGIYWPQRNTAKRNVVGKYDWESRWTQALIEHEFNPKHPSIFRELGAPPGGLSLSRCSEKWSTSFQTLRQNKNGQQMSHFFPELCDGLFHSHFTKMKEQSSTILLAGL